MLNIMKCTTYSTYTSNSGTRLYASAVLLVASIVSSITFGEAAVSLSVYVLGTGWNKLSMMYVILKYC